MGRNCPHPRSFLEIGIPDDIVIYFGMETKSSRTQPFRPHLFAVIHRPFTRELEQFLLPRVNATGTGVPLFPVPTATIRWEILQPWGYSAHSMKLGTILHLLQALPEGNPHLALLPPLGIARHLGTGS